MKKTLKMTNWSDAVNKTQRLRVLNRYKSSIPFCTPITYPSDLFCAMCQVFNRKHPTYELISVEKMLDHSIKYKYRQAIGNEEPKIFVRIISDQFLVD